MIDKLKTKEIDSTIKQMKKNELFMKLEIKNCFN